jgi:hypothetical protein
LKALLHQIISPLNQKEIEEKKQNKTKHTFILFLISTRKWPPPYPLSQSFSNFSSLHHQTSDPLISRNPKPLHLRTQSRKPISIKALSAPILTQDDLKKLGDDKAVDYVKPGMVLGLGTGSTAAKLGHLLQTGQLSNINAPRSKPANWVSLSRSSTTTCAFTGVNDYLLSVFLPKQFARLQRPDAQIASPTEPYKLWVMGHDHKKQDRPEVQNGAPNNTEFNRV